MYYLFRRPPINSSSSNYELIAESHDLRLIQSLFESFVNLADYRYIVFNPSELILRTDPDASEEASEEATEEESEVREFSRPDGPPVDRSLEPYATKKRRRKE